MATREAIFATEDIDSEILPVPEWSTKIEIRSMDGTARAKFMQRLYNAQIETGSAALPVLYPAIVIATAHDPETGTLLFLEEDEVSLAAKNGQVLERLALKGIELSRLQEEAVEEAGKGSSSTTSDDSSSESVPNSE